MLNCDAFSGFSKPLLFKDLFSKSMLVEPTSVQNKFAECAEMDTPNTRSIGNARMNFVTML